MNKPEVLKDEALDNLSSWYNVARFASFSPTGELRYECHNFVPSRMELQGKDITCKSPDLRSAAQKLLRYSGKVNVRTFKPEESQGNPFVLGLESVDDIEALAQKLMSEGYYIILNEWIDPCDGGVSGVVQGRHVEFAPNTTPRCVENMGCSSIPARIAEIMLSELCATEILLPCASRSTFKTARFEFSAHPTPKGNRNEHVVIWEKSLGLEMQTKIRQPDPFSRWVGDKVYGLLLAYAESTINDYGYSVPRCMVFKKDVMKPFLTFGSDTGVNNCWTRSCPAEQVPGKFSTYRGFHDPYAIMAEEDVVSVIVQQEVDAKWSGGGVCDDESVAIEGVRGFGDRYMLGMTTPETLPEDVNFAVSYALRNLSAVCESGVRVEWAWDGDRLWILQLHIENVNTDTINIVPGTPEKWIRWEADQGLESLRALVRDVDNTGIILCGGVGFSSHAADIVRKANIPARIE